MDRGPDEPPQRVTLQTIADLLKVSRMTVSNAYNRPDQLSPELRRRILEAAERLGYPGPDPAGRLLRRGRSGVTGLIFTENLSYAFTDPVSVLFLAGVAQACEQHGHGLLLLPSGADPQAVRQAVVDAFLVYSLSTGSAVVDAVLARRLPTVIVDEPRLEGVPFVGIDDRGGARAAADHLVGLGHRRLAVVADRLRPDGHSGPVTPRREAAATFDVARRRLAGYREACAAAGIAWGDVPVEECASNVPEDGADAAARLLGSEDPPTAVLAASDQLAVGVLRYAAGHGIRVPERLSVVGFDDSPAAAAATPPLTTVRQPIPEKGRTAGRLLLDPSAAGRGTEVLLPTELVVRRSTGPAVRDRAGRDG